MIQGDHGDPAAELDAIGVEDKLRARFGIMNAYRLPNGGDSLLYPSITPINTFRVIFNYYLGAEFELLEDKTYNSIDFDSPSRDLADFLAQGFKD